MEIPHPAVAIHQLCSCRATLVQPLDNILSDPCGLEVVCPELMVFLFRLRDAIMVWEVNKTVASAGLQWSNALQRCLVSLLHSLCTMYRVTRSEKTPVLDALQVALTHSLKCAKARDVQNCLLTCLSRIDTQAILDTVGQEPLVFIRGMSHEMITGLCKFTFCDSKARAYTVPLLIPHLPLLISHRVLHKSQLLAWLDCDSVWENMPHGLCPAWDTGDKIMVVMLHLFCPNVPDPMRSWLRVNDEGHITHVK